METIVRSPQELGHAIRTVRKSKNLNQEEVGQPFRLGQRTISTIEQGFSGTRVDTLFRILAALNLDLVVRTRNDQLSTDAFDPDRW